MFAEDDQKHLELAAAGALNEVNCPDASPERVAFLASFLTIAEEVLPDPRPDHPPLRHRVVRVLDRDGGTRMRGQRPVTIAELIGELVAGYDTLHKTRGRHVGAALRWRPYGS